LTLVVLLVLVPRLGAAAALTATPVGPSLGMAERLPLMLAPALGSSLLALNAALGISKPRWRLRAAPGELRRADGPSSPKPLTA
jgi:hypothetical protein